MKSLNFLLIVFGMMLFSCSGNSGKGSAGDAGIEGEEVVNNVVPVNDLLQDPESYVGKVVEVEGLVTHVCKHSGKRLHLTSPATNDMIRVEATGEIRQFERELEGSEVRVRGKVQKLVIDEEYLAKWENEMSKGETHDHSQNEAETEQLHNMRKRLESSGQDQLVSYWVDGTSFEVN